MACPLRVHIAPRRRQNRNAKPCGEFVVPNGPMKGIGPYRVSRFFDSQKPPPEIPDGGFLLCHGVRQAEADRDGRVDLIHDLLVRVAHVLAQTALVDGADLL